MSRRGPLVVVGDSLLDVDLVGSATRLSPDAPVPVVDVRQRWQRPGGAGLAALLAAHAGEEVVLVTAVGDDEAGEVLRDLLRPHVELRALPLAGGTVVKTRVAASGVPLLRLDTGAGRAAEGPLPRPVVTALTGAGAVLVSDYGRGVAALPALRARLQACTARVPVVWDPHVQGGPPVPDAALVTPNLVEARHASALTEAEEAGHHLCRTWAVRAVAVTLGERGALLTEAEPRRSVPVPLVGATPAAGHPAVGQPRPDTCGAGDRFATAAGAALLAGADAEEAVRTAVVQAAEYVRAGAAATVSVSSAVDVGPHAPRSATSRTPSRATAAVRRAGPQEVS